MTISQSLLADRHSLSKLVGLGRLELPTSRLSSARSNQLSYKPEPIAPWRFAKAIAGGSSCGEERETKTAASRQIGLTGRLFLEGRKDERQAPGQISTDPERR
jgi:hypothetical protein